jgi:hypothetical protein
MVAPASTRSRNNRLRGTAESLSGILRGPGSLTRHRVPASHAPTSHRSGRGEELGSKTPGTMHDNHARFRAADGPRRSAREVSRRETRPCSSAASLTTGVCRRGSPSSFSRAPSRTAGVLGPESGGRSPRTVENDEVTAESTVASVGNSSPRPRRRSRARRPGRPVGRPSRPPRQGEEPRVRREPPVGAVRASAGPAPPRPHSASARFVPSACAATHGRSSHSQIRTAPGTTVCRRSLIPTGTVPVGNRRYKPRRNEAKPRYEIRPGLKNRKILTKKI